MELLWIEPTSPWYPGHLELRYQVLRRPLGMGRDTIGFKGEEESQHLVAVADGLVIGCVIMHRESGAARLRAMAVAAHLQKGGVGRALVTELENRALACGIYEVTLHARVLAIGFYEKLGYEAFGSVFTEVGLPHRHMRKQLAVPGSPP